jgi:hypothetical protein
MDFKLSIDAEGVRTPSTDIGIRTPWGSEADESEWLQSRYMTPEAGLPQVWGYPVPGTAHMSFGSAVAMEEHQSWNSMCQMGPYAQFYHSADYMADLTSAPTSPDSDNGDQDTFDAKNLQAWHGRVVDMALGSESGSRLIQSLLASGAYTTKLQISMEMGGHVAELVDSPWGNFAVTQAIEALPRQDTIFIVQEVTQYAGELAIHQFGIRLFLRLAEHHGTTSASGLFDNVVNDTASLATHQYGNFAISSVLEYGAEKHRAEVAEALLKAGVAEMSTNQYASNVVQQALKRCTAHQSMMVDALVNSMELLQSSPSGRHVLEALQEAFPTVVAQADLNQRIPWATTYEFLQNVNLRVLREHARPLVELAKINCSWSKAVQDAIAQQAWWHPRECVQILTQVLCGGQLLEVVTSRHGNFVVSELLALKSLQSTDLVTFITGELRGAVAEVSMNQFGYRTVQNLIEYSRDIPDALAREILNAASPLACHQFGNFVLQKFIWKIGKNRLRTLMQCLDFDQMKQDRYGKFVIGALSNRTPHDARLKKASAHERV